jgi:2-polyprenyl-3-methyl-5-hydroxy-6-metoxy-1,4-benzoquinol methylase
VPIDRSNGWEAIAESIIGNAPRSTVGVTRVEAWTRALPAGAAVLDLGCGPGGPRSQCLHDAGLKVHAIDASPTLAEAYRHRFPRAKVACEAVEEMSCFDRTFDGVLAWGLMFLLPEETQRSLIGRVARALSQDGRFLFTAPAQACTWADLSTGRPSLSLGAEAYTRVLHGAGLAVLREYDDEGENHYYDAVKLAP